VYRMIKRCGRVLVLAAVVGAAVITGAPPASAAGPGVVINELRTRGPGGALDEFVELYNSSNVAVNISGWKLRGSNGSGVTADRVVIPAATTLAPNRFYLIANSGGYTGPSDLTYAIGVTDDGGVAIVNAGSVIVDQVGFSNGSAFIEASAAATPTTDETAQRQPDGVDTDNNAVDFATAPPTPQTSAFAPTSDVAITDFTFTPHAVTVTEGDRVFFRNNGATTHTATADDGAFDSGNLAPGGVFAVTMPTIGSFSYHCSIHLAMTGVIDVQPRRGRFHPVGPTRILDTRVTHNPLTSGETRIVVMKGFNGIPRAGVSGFVINVTTTNTTADGFLTVFPTGSAVPVASNVNFLPNQSVANLVSVRVGTSGTISIFNSAGQNDLILDLAGYYDTAPAGPAGRFQPITPARALDTRLNGGPLGSGATRSVQVTGVGAVPASGVTAIAVNLTVTQPTSASFLTAWPAGASQPNVSNLNFVAGQTLANRAIIPVPTSGPNAGKINIANAFGSTQVVVDVSGWFTETGSGAGAISSIKPVRLLDTRGGTKVAGGAPLTVQVTSAGGVPTGATAAILNVTVVRPNLDGWVTVWPSGVAAPSTSDVNFAPGQIVPNLVVVKLGASGGVDISISQGVADVIVDVSGFVT